MKGEKTAPHLDGDALYQMITTERDREKDLTLLFHDSLDLCLESSLAKDGEVTVRYS